MYTRLNEVPTDVLEAIAWAIRGSGQSLTADITSALVEDRGLDEVSWHSCSQMILDLLTVAVEDGRIDDRRGGIHDLSRMSPPLTLRQIIRAIHSAEGVVLGELALNDRLGATTEAWGLVEDAVRIATLEVIAAVAERAGGPPALRDQLTTLIAHHVFDLVLEQEALRARRHHHGIAMLLFDVDDLAQLNRAHGYGAGDRLLERLGMQARRFFRTHDWVARHGDDSIAVLLPETTLDQAAALAARFRDMIQHRLVLVDHKTEQITSVRVSGAAVGTDLVQAEIDPAYILAEAEAAVLRAKMNGGNRVERVALLPTSFTILGTATVLGTTPREVIRMVRDGTLRAGRRGRHFHIDRTEIEELTRRSEA